MLRLAKAFLDIALWRQTPANLPASTFLLGLVACAAALLELLGAMLPPSANGEILMRIVLGVGLPLGFTWTVLGVGVLAELILYPLGAMLRALGSDRLLSIPVGLLLYVGLIWYLLACAHIW